MKFRNRLGAFSNLAIMSMHAKFQLIWAIRLARAMGVVRKLTSHLIFGGNLYMLDGYESRLGRSKRKVEEA